MVFSKYLIHGALKTYLWVTKNNNNNNIKNRWECSSNPEHAVYVPQVWDLNTLQLTDVLSIPKD